MEIEKSIAKVEAINSIIKAFGSNPKTRLNDKHLAILSAMRREEYRKQNKIISEMLSDSKHN